MGEKENVCLYLYVLLCVLLEDTMSSKTQEQKWLPLGSKNYV